MQNGKLSFRNALESHDILSVTWELVPGRGAREKSQENVLKMAELAAKNPKVNGITITDNPGGKPAILSLPLAVEVLKLGIEPVIHLTCKDKNRNDIESELYALARSGINNLLVMTGDYPTEGYKGLPKPVFDLDSVNALRLVNQMNKGIEIASAKGQSTLQKTNFFAGAVVSPFKKSEAELMNQYFKLHKKINAGAGFIITQLGYDVRKFDELKKYMDANNLNVPLIGNIYVLTQMAAKLMNKNSIPGCVVSDEMLKVIESEKNSNNFKELQLLRSAKLFALLKGLKFSGVNIGGIGLTNDDISYIIDKGQELSKNWQDVLEEIYYPQKETFYYYNKGDSKYFNSKDSVDRRKTGSKKRSIVFAVFNIIHKIYFNRKSPLFPLLKLAARVIDKSFLNKPFTYFEYFIKTITNQCRFCGDCVIHELGFICPMAICPKQQRNGACGGSTNEWCEVYPEKQKCIYVSMYGYLKASGVEDKLKEGYIPPCNWELHRTSSWLNFYLGRDYSGREK